MNIKTLAFRFYKAFNILPFNNTTKGNVSVENQGSLLLNCEILSNGTNNKLFFARGGVFRNCKFSLLGDNNTISFGENCHATNGDFYIEDDNNLIKTCDNTNYAGKIHIACTEGTNIIIGDDCLFSSEIAVRSGDSHSILNGNGKRINEAQDVIVGNHVWVGYRALITKGTVIPDNTVVGTGAIVTGTFDKGNIILAGVPARVVKEDINWDKKRI